MIPQEYVLAWRAHAPWRSLAMVEQDLVLSRALVEIFGIPLACETCTLRGGTALNKLIFDPPARYSEDIDLVQEKPGPIGPLLDAIRGRLDSWLGKPRFESNGKMNTLVWRFKTESEPPEAMRLKVEINTREHGWLGKAENVAYRVENPWFTGSADVSTVVLEDLMATKFRALYQRRKARDLFDLHTVLERFPDLDLRKVIAGFKSVMARENRSVSWEEFSGNMESKLSHRMFIADVPPLLMEGDFQPVEIWQRLSPRLQSTW